MTRILFAFFLLLVPSLQTLAGDPQLEAMARGVGAIREEAYDKAIAEFTEAIRLDPMDFQAYKYRASVYLYKNQATNAIKDLSELIRLNPTDAESYAARGGAYLSNSQSDDAIKDFCEIIRLCPTKPEGYAARGSTYLCIRRFGDAIKDFSESIRLNPTNATWYMMRGTLYEYNKEYDDAFKDFSESVRLDPTKAGAYSGRGLIYLRKKEYDKAVEDSTEAIRLDPKLSTGYTVLAWVLAVCPKDMLRNGKKAVELATKGCELSEWGNPFSLGALAAAYAECGDFKEAVKWQKKVIELTFLEKEKSQKRLKLYEEGKPDRDD